MKYSLLCLFAFVFSTVFATDHELLILNNKNKGLLKVIPGGGVYEDGEVVEITVLPKPGYYFKGWSGDTVANSFTIRLTMNQDMTIRASFSEAQNINQRQRPRIGNGTLLSDRGSLLRGCFISTDYYHFNQSKIKDGTKEGIFKAVNEYGMNAFHFYCGWYATPTGTYQPLADSLVEWTREAGAYLVITIGGWDKNGWYDISKVREFWNYYAPRYANEPHVIYEIQNEPFFVCNEASPDSVTNMEIEAYNIIREYTTTTPILLMSYGSIPVREGIRSDIQRLEQGGVDFDNALIAYHGYYWCARARKHDKPIYDWATEMNILPEFIEEGYAFINTEFDRDSTLNGNSNYSGKLIEFYENDREVSWLSFLSFPREEGNLANLFGTGTQFKEKIVEMNVSWCPDNGTWPETSTTCNPVEFHSLEVISNGNGQVEIFPPGNAFLDSTILTITALPDVGYSFDNWEGASDDTSTTIELLLDNNKNLTANFTVINGMTDGEIEKSFQLYPNPCKTYLDIIAEIPIHSMAISDVLGRIRYMETNITGKKRIDISGFKSGLYFVTCVLTNESTIKRKFLKL